MLVATCDHCVMCLRQRDNYSTYERNEQSSIASTSPLNQLDAFPGRTKCSERSIIAYQNESESLAEMPAGCFASAPSQWFCCGCKKFDLIPVYSHG